MILSLIVAMDKNRVIGADNKLPWKLPSDLKRFKKITTGHPIIMGRKTYESIGRALPDRVNIIVTKNNSFQAKGCIITHSLNEALEYAKKTNDKESFIIGGSTLFSEGLPIASKLYLTFIDDEFTGNVYFPKINFKNWKKTEELCASKSNSNPHAYTYSIWQKNNVDNSTNTPA